MRSHCKQSKVNPTVELLELLRESWSKNEFARKRMLHRLLWIGSNRPFRNWTTSSLSFFLVRGAKRQDTQMATRVTAALVSRVSRRSRVRGLPSLNLKKKRNRSQSIQKWDPEGVYSLQRLPCSVFKQIKIHVTQRHFYRVYSSKKAVWVSILSHSSFVYHKIIRWEKDY